jgi:hypothetical protein
VVAAQEHATRRRGVGGSTHLRLFDEDRFVVFWNEMLTWQANDA